MGSMWNGMLGITIFGQSHSSAIGVTIDGLPAGIAVDMEKLTKFLARRAPGKNAISTARKESDIPEFLSGLKNDVTCGAPLTAIIHNRDQHSQDYDIMRDIPRPSHADYTAHVKFKGYEDVAGGGHFSGRLTAPLCIAGGIILQYLEKMGISIGAHLQSVGEIEDMAFEPETISKEQLQTLHSMEFPVLNSCVAEGMQNEIRKASSEGDSIGGTVECAAINVPAGWGDPMFGGMENRIAALVFGIPGVRGIEFGKGFSAAKMRGSEHNDPFCIEGQNIRTTTNHHAGILGGISSGMPIVFRCAFKPTASISIPQQSISYSKMEETVLTIHGRHDPCIAHRAVPVVESAMAIAICDAWLAYRVHES